MVDLSLDSDFFDIPAGKYEIALSSGSATIEYIERWL